MSRADDFWLGRNYEVKGVGAVRRAGDISLYTSANPIRSVTLGREIKRYNRNTHSPDLMTAMSFSAIAKNTAIELYTEGVEVPVGFRSREIAQKQCSHR